MTTDDVGGFLDNMPSDDVLAVRDRAIFELAYSSGLRVAELASLQLSDLDQSQGMGYGFWQGRQNAGGAGGAQGTGSFGALVCAASYAGFG